MARIVRFHQYGDPSVLKIEDLDVPPPAADEVQIEVKSIGLNRAEVMFRTHAYLQEAISESARVRGCGYRQNRWDIRNRLQEGRCCQFDPAARYSTVGQLRRIGQRAGSQSCQASREHLVRSGCSILDAVRHGMGRPY